MAKKKKDAPESPAASLDAPRPPETAAAWEAFERGDFRAARAQAKALLAHGPAEPVARSAREILERTDLEPGTRLTLIGMVLALAAIIALVATHR